MPSCAICFPGLPTKNQKFLLFLFLPAGKLTPRFLAETKFRLSLKLKAYYLRDAGFWSVVRSSRERLPSAFKVKNPPPF